MIDDDLSVFFDLDEFAEPFTRLGDSPVPFAGILSDVDQEQLGGYVVAATRELRYATAAVTLHQDQLLAQGSSTWRVLDEPRRVNDGRESVVYLVAV